MKFTGSCLKHDYFWNPQLDSRGCPFCKLKQLQTKYESLLVPKKVEEQLPKYSGKYLCWFYNDWLILFFNNKKQWCYFNNKPIQKDKVPYLTHWIFLPNPPDLK